MTRFRGKISRDYDLLPPALPWYFEMQDLLASAIAEKRPGPIVLDLGVGTGITTKAILAWNPDCRVSGVDNEPAMIEQARANLAAEISTDLVTLHNQDALEYLLGLPAGSVDVVASSYTVHNCVRDYRERLAVQILRVLRNGGMFANNDKYATNDRTEYVREITAQIIRYDRLKEMGREDLRTLWIEHEIEDNLPDLIMWADETLAHMRMIGFASVSLVARRGQYAVVTAMKPVG